VDRKHSTLEVGEDLMAFEIGDTVTVRKP